MEVAGLSKPPLAFGLPADGHLPLGKGEKKIKGGGLMTKIFNRSNELDKRRLLRSNPTEAEKIIWNNLRKRNLFGFKFRRQYSIGPYITDFYCPKAKLVIEIDGKVHESAEAIDYDKVRDEFIKSIGIRVLRFTNDEVEKSQENVISKIYYELNNFSPPNKGGDVA
jgi:very-short-patch-repair endonuclease